jgi:hypothetical protein
MNAVDRMRRWERWVSRRSLASFAVSRLTAELYRDKSTWAASILVRTAAGSLQPAAGQAFQALVEGCEDPRAVGGVIYESLLHCGGQDDSDTTWTRVTGPLLLGDSPPRLIRFLDHPPADSPRGTEPADIIRQLMMCVSFSSPRRPDLEQFLSSTDQPLIVEALRAGWSDKSFLPNDIVTDVGVANPHLQPAGTGRSDVLLAVVKDRLDLLDFTNPYTVDALLRGAQMKRADLADKFLRVLKTLPPGTAQERLCKIVTRSLIPDDAATVAALEAGYLPEGLQDRVLFLFLTQQWSLYDAIDPTGDLLYTAFLQTHRSADLRDHTLTWAIIETARHNGRPDPAARYLEENPVPEHTRSDGPRPSVGGYSSDYGFGGDHGSGGWTGGSFHT